MSNTKKVYLKLQAPKSRLDLYTDALCQALENGWERWDSKVHNGATMVRVTLYKIVPYNSSLPEHHIWNCRPETTPTFSDPIEGSCFVGEMPIAPTIETVNELLTQMEVIKDNIDVIATEFEEHLDKAALPVTDKSVSGFDKRPYTLEEVQAMKWTKLSQLSGDLGVGSGNKQQREAAVVAASQEQWG